MIVAVDIDGTLAIGNGFDLSVKSPNTSLIEKINSLKKSGNYIKIVTARGAYNTTIEERTAKYYHPIKTFLDTSGVLYDEISFNKEFADVYIDDLAIRPDEVIITKDLSSTFTDNIVTRINDTVIKSGKTVEDEYEWYNAYQDKADIPEVLNVTRHSLIYKFIERDGDVMSGIYDVIEKYKNYSKLNNLLFDSYIANIVNHLKNNKSITNGDKLINELSFLNIEPTFAHGDLSIDNIVPTKDGIKLIDPLYSKNKFGSFEIDLAKLYFSIKFYKEKSINFFDENSVLIASEAVRVATYKPSFSFIAENLINEL